MARDDDFNLDDLDSLTFESLDEDHSDDPTQYGVWVKSGPEDITEGQEEGPSGSSDVTLSDEDFLSSDELAGLESSLAPSGAIDLEGEAPDDDLTADTSTFLDTPGGAEEIDLDEFITFEDSSSGDDSSSEVEPASLRTEDQSDDEFIDIDIEVSDSIADEELEIIENAQVEHQAPSPGGMSDTLDEIGTPEPTVDFSDEFDQILAEEKSNELNFDSEPEVDHEKLDRIENTLTQSIQTDQEPPAAPSSLAEILLKKIESELASIKSEISELKARLGNLSTVPETRTADVEGRDTTPAGFFPEDEDEVIALTGDELDSILSSADITSENPVEATTAADTMEREDLLQLDADGNVVDSAEPTSDVDLLQGTNLESSLNEDAEIPNYPLESPLPGSATFQGGVPDSITLEEDVASDRDDDFDKNLDLVGESLSEVDQAAGTVPESEIDFEQPESVPAAVQLVDDAEDVTAAFFGDEPSTGDTEDDLSLEIPFDDELLLDEDVREAPAPAAESAASDPDLDLGGPIPEEAPVTATPVAASADLPVIEEPAPPPSQPSPTRTESEMPSGRGGLSEKMKEEIKSVLSYMDKLLASLPDEKIQEFAESEHFEVYKKLFEELGLTE